jgi:hypothetical protein
MRNYEFALLHEIYTENIWFYHMITCTPGIFILTKSWTKTCVVLYIDCIVGDGSYEALGYFEGPSQHYFWEAGIRVVGEHVKQWWRYTRQSSKILMSNSFSFLKGSPTNMQSLEDYQRCCRGWRVTRRYAWHKKGGLRQQN